MHLAILITGVLSFFWRHGNSNLFTLAVKPGFLDFDNLPDTNFSCENKVIGGYYADIETGCQMFHVCTLGQKGEVTDIKFLCLNGTVFDQETRVCERLDEVDCSKSESYFDLNLELYGNNALGFGIEAENESPATSDKEEECGENEGEDEEACKGTGSKDDFLDEYDDTTLTPTTTTTTAKPTTTLTTISAPRPTTPRPAFHSPKPTLPPTAQYSTSPTHNPNFGQNIQYPPSSPETIAALLALHNAFQESLKQHDIASKQGPPIETPPSNPKPTKTVLENQNRPQPPRIPAPLYNVSPKPTGFSINYHSGNNENSQLPSLRPQFHFDPPPVPKPSYHPTITSERFGTANFHHGFHISSQPNPPRQHFSTFQQPNLRYFSENKQSPSQPPPLVGGASPKPFSFNPSNQHHSDRKQEALRLRQVEDPEEEEEEEEIEGGEEEDEGDISTGQKSLETHSSFVRAIPDSPKHNQKAVYPSLTTPAVSVVLTTSSISSSRAQSVNVKSPPSAILKSPPTRANIQAQRGVKELFSSRQNASSTGKDKPKSNSYPSFSQYQDEHANYDTFFTDVSKIRTRRNAKRNLSQTYFNESSNRLFDVIEVRHNYPIEKNISLGSKLNCSQKLNDSHCNYNVITDDKTNIQSEVKNSNTASKENRILKKRKRKTNVSKSILKNFYNVDFELSPATTLVRRPVKLKIKKTVHP